MPYPTEHAARQVDPDTVTQIRRENGAFIDNNRQIDALWGQKHGRTVLQSLRFPSATWSAAAAKRWLHEHDYSTAAFEPATGRDMKNSGKIDAAVQEYADAHWGVNPDVVYVVDHDRYVPDTVVQMGFLKELHVDCGGVCEDHESVKLTFRKPSSVAYAHDSSTRVFLVLSERDKADMIQLYQSGKIGACAGGRLSDIAKKIGGRQCRWKFPVEPVAVLGICTHIVYQTTKQGDGKSNYIHEFGEEAGGIKPALCIDADGHLLLAGGSYVVEHRGIVN